jgi:hypothetical protein
MTTTEWLPQCYSARAVYLHSHVCAENAEYDINWQILEELKNKQ